MLQKKEDTREYCTLRFLRHLDGCPAYAASEEYFLFNAHPCQSPQCCCAKYGRSHALCDPKLLPTPRSILAVVPDRVDHLPSMTQNYYPLLGLSWQLRLIRQMPCLV